MGLRVVCWAVTSLAALLSLTTHFISSPGWSGVEHQAAGRREGRGGRGGHTIRLSSTIISNTARLEGREIFYIMRNIFIYERERDRETAATSSSAAAGRER